LQVPENEIPGAPMADDLKETGRQEDARINLDQEYEMACWTERFGNQLRSAVAKAGPMGEECEGAPAAARLTVHAKTYY
jgi:hypothetical protein